MHRDLAVGIVGAAVLLVGLVVVFVYESGSTPAPTLSFPVTFPSRDGGVVTQRGGLDQGADAPHDFELPVANATTARIVLEWTDDVGDPDTFNVTVTGPSGVAPVSGEASTGTIELVVTLNQRPAATTMAGTDPVSIEASAAERFGASRGEGAWNVVVRLVDAPGQRPIPQAPQIEIAPDGANDYELVFGYQYFEAEIGEPAPPA